MDSRRKGCHILIQRLIPIQLLVSMSNTMLRPVPVFAAKICSHPSPRNPIDAQWWKYWNAGHFADHHIRGNTWPGVDVHNITYIYRYNMYERGIEFMRPASMWIIEVDACQIVGWVDANHPTGQPANGSLGCWSENALCTFDGSRHCSSCGGGGNTEIDRQSVPFKNSFNPTAKRFIDW